MSKFNADSITATNWTPVFKVTRKSPELTAIQLNLPEGFEITTAAGVVTGKSEDYIIINAEDGTKSIVAKKDFHKKYNILNAEVAVESAPELPKIAEPVVQPVQAQRSKRGAQVGNVVSQGMGNLFKGTTWGN